MLSIIVGRTASGKTTLAEELKKKGFIMKNILNN